MPMIEWLKQLAFYGIAIAVAWAVIVYIPRFKRVAVPSDYSEISGIETVTDYALDASATLATLSLGDGISYQLADDGEHSVRLGWIAGLPGDLLLSDATGKLLVNGQAVAHGGTLPGPPFGPLVIPAGHFVVVTDTHLSDSLNFGPLPEIALRGKIGTLP